MANENNLCTGTITVTAASATVSGGSSNFDPQVKAFLTAGQPAYLKFIDNGGTYRALRVKSVESDTSLTLIAAAPTGSSATAVVFYCGIVLDTYLKPGATGTGTIEVVGNVVTGTATNFDPQTPAGTRITYPSSTGDAVTGIVDSVADDDEMTLTSSPGDTAGSKAFVFATVAQNAVMFSQFSGGDGVQYILKTGDLQVIVPAAAVSAAEALGWSLTASPIAGDTPSPPAADTPMLPPTNDATTYDVIGQDGLSYHLAPYNDAGTYKLTVPRMAVNPALDDLWTIE